MLNFDKFKQKTIKCAGLGEVLFDVFESGPKIGGAPANFAYHCKQNGLDAITISSVGKDELGFKARNLLANRFLPALLIESNKATGCVHIKVDCNGVPSYNFDENTAFDNIHFTDDLNEIAHKLDMVCFGSLAQRNNVSHQTIMKVLDTLSQDAIKVFDVNLRANFYSKEVILSSLQRTNIFKCNEDELPILCNLLGVKGNTCKDFYAYLKTQGIDCFIFTQGSVQSTVFLNDEISSLPTPKVKVVDTVGAGDAFTATIVSKLMQGESLTSAHQKAVKYAAYVCTQSGAMPDIPSSYL